MNIDRWAERIYTERDFGRSIATSGSGIVGLATYISTGDWVIAAFCAVIVFPLIRVISFSLHARYRRHRTSGAQREQIRKQVKKLTADEKEVLRAFVREGGSVLPAGRVNRLGVPESGVESLFQRGIMYSTMTVDGMREALAIEVEVFDTAQEELSSDDDF